MLLINQKTEALQRREVLIKVMRCLRNGAYLLSFVEWKCLRACVICWVWGVLCFGFFFRWALTTLSMGSDRLWMHLSFSFANLAMLHSCWDDPGGGQERGLVPRAGSAWGKPASRHCRAGLGAAVWFVVPTRSQRWDRVSRGAIRRFVFMRKDSLFKTVNAQP